MTPPRDTGHSLDESLDESLTRIDPRADSASSPVDVEVLAGHPDAAEIAALTAVLTAMGDGFTHGGRLDSSGPSAWERSQRVLREPVVPGPHAWGGFSG